jgi:hypothetical protein
MVGSSGIFSIDCCDTGIYPDKLMESTATSSGDFEFPRPKMEGSAT